MRLNRQTLIILGGSIIVIMAVLLLLNSPASAPELDENDTPALAGPIFPDVDQEAVVQFGVRSSIDESFTLMARNEAGIWTVTDGTDIRDDVDLDQMRVVGSMGVLASLQATDGFTADDLTPYGLDDPLYIMTLITDDSTVHSVSIGNKNPAGTRYYALVGDDTATVYLLTRTFEIDNLARIANEPPYAIPPTPTPTPELGIPGPAFPDMMTFDITSFELRDHTEDAFLLLTRAADFVWSVEEGSYAEEGRTVDQTTVNVAIGGLAALRLLDGFSDVDDLARFGLDEPRYTLVAVGSMSTHTLQIGGSDPSGLRYYALVDEFDTVVVIDADAVDALLRLIVEPPYSAVEVTPEATADPEATPEATAEATDEP